METLEIRRIDYKNPRPTGGYYPHPVPVLNDINQITDVNEVYTIEMGFDIEEDAIEFASKFPKSYKAKLFKSVLPRFYVSFCFNTFYHNEVTGSVNEIAIKNREKVIAKLKTLI